MTYESLTLSNDFIFAKVMQDEKLCKHLLEIILDIKIKSICYHEEQKVLADSPDGKAVRLDVFVDDDINTLFDIEMQASNTKELPKRSRFYQSRIDDYLLDKGVEISYNDLKDSYVIFICMQDIFEKGRHYYRFENLCVDSPDIRLNDGTVKIFLNPDSMLNDIGEDLANFLDYVKTGEPRDSFTEELDKSVAFARQNKAWKEEYRMINMRDRVNYRNGRHDMIFELVSKGIITVEIGAEELDISIPEFEIEMTESGYKIPATKIV